MIRRSVNSELPFAPAFTLAAPHRCTPPDPKAMARTTGSGRSCAPGVFQGRDDTLVSSQSRAQSVPLGRAWAVCPIGGAEHAAQRSARPWVTLAVSAVLRRGFGLQDPEPVTERMMSEDVMGLIELAENEGTSAPGWLQLPAQRRATWDAVTDQSHRGSHGTGCRHRNRSCQAPLPDPATDWEVRCALLHRRSTQSALQNEG